MKQQTKAEKIHLLKLLAEKERRRKQNLSIEYFNMFYDWQVDFCGASRDYFESCLMAANQIGKTLAGTTIDAIHLLGNYPENWTGHKFNFAPRCWCLGYSMEKTRDLLQTALFGKYDKKEGFEGGLIPKDKILGWEACIGIPNAMRTIKVKHVLGTSVVQFWSYSQGQHAIMGDVVDWVHVDEEPKDQTIRGQLLRATLNGDKGRGGRIMYTFTPENGRTSLVIKFMDNPSKDQFFMQKGWVDAPHMTPEKIARAMEQFPAHEIDMRSKGDPMLGHGRIYDISDEFILCDPFEIPDHYKTICGLDIGSMSKTSHPQAIVKIAYDVESDIVYVVNSWKAVGVSANDAWGATKSWSEGYPLAWPHDGLQQETGRDDSVEVIKHYAHAGFKMLHEHAQWPPTIDKDGKPKKGGISVESGIYDITNRMSKGKWKIFRGQQDYMDEHRQYHRDEKGNIVKIKDDIMSAVRYAYMMLRFAVYNKQLNSIITQRSERPRPIQVIGFK